MPGVVLLDVLYILHCNQAGGRKVLMDVVPILWNDVSSLVKSGTAARSPLLRKYLMKLTQRIGLTCLPHRSPAWCYVVSNFQSLTSSCSNFIHFECLNLG